MDDRHAVRREEKRRRRAKGGKKMIVQGKGYVTLTLAAIAKGASK